MLCFIFSGFQAHQTLTLKNRALGAPEGDLSCLAVLMAPKGRAVGTTTAPLEAIVTEASEWHQGILQ